MRQSIVNHRLLLAAATSLVLAACASIPSGPSVLVLPGTNRSFDQFRADDLDCRQYAHFQIGGKTPDQTAADAGVKSAVVGTAIGAVAGAAIGGRQGAAVGAGTGLIVGSAAGADSGYRSAYDSQRLYDNAFIQCMYAKGHRVPVPAGMALPSLAPRTPSGNIPPPPPGSPPPPPPGVR